MPSVTASEAGTAQSENPRALGMWELWSRGTRLTGSAGYNSLLRQRAKEGNSPVMTLADSCNSPSRESCCLGLQHKMGGNILLKLNIRWRPIANKYREGKMKRTLKRK